MDFMTHVQVTALPKRITLRSRILSLGSCFAQAVGGRLAANCFDIKVNPTGTLYNPESVAMTIEDLWAEGQRADVLLLTFGTSHVYRLADGQVVTNCRKRPASMFTEDDLTVEYIVNRYVRLLTQLRADVPQLQVLFTVSPYRYTKYGLHGSALSKARLLLAVDEICSKVEDCHYFPAYEIVTDELRDYRFYEADMVHPNAVAADYVWERFREACLDDEARQFVADYAPILRAQAHKPFDAESKDYRDFVAKTEQQRIAILKRYGM